MADIYLTKPGRVGIVRGHGTMPGSIQILDSNGGKFSVLSRVIITAIGYNQMCNVQFLQTLDNAIYVYSFGDRIGEIQVQGLAFAGRACRNGQAGVVDILQYYRNNRLSKSGLPVTVAIGTEIIKGYLIGCRVLTQNPETATYAWVLEIAAIPEQDDARAQSSDGSDDSEDDTGSGTNSGSDEANSGKGIQDAV
jgi:hypothetical protein